MLSVLVRLRSFKGLCAKQHGYLLHCPCSQLHLKSVWTCPWSGLGAPGISFLVSGGLGCPLLVNLEVCSGGLFSGKFVGLLGFSVIVMFWF